MAPKTILAELGLTQKEAAVYLATMELGQASVMRIAEKASVKRPTTYVILRNLQEKGFVEALPKGNTTLYQAIDPELLIRDSEQRIERARAILPELRSLLNSAPGKPKVRFYEGKKAIIGLYEHEIFQAPRILAAVNMRSLRAMISREELFGTLHLLKANKGSIREFIEDSPEAKEYLEEKNRLGLGDTKLLPSEMNLGIDILAYGGKTAMISPRTAMAVVIEDRAISNAQEQFLEYLWLKN